jgi:zinc protease
MKKIPLLLIMALIPISPRAGNDDVRLDVKTHTFSNGLELLVVERRLSPTFTAIVRFKVGSADEKPGITGSAHLLEHM